MGKGEPSNKDASKTHLEDDFHPASLLLPSPLVGEGLGVRGLSLS